MSHLVKDLAETSAASLNSLPELITSLDFSVLTFRRYEDSDGWAAEVTDIKYCEKISLRCKRVVNSTKSQVDLPFGMTISPDLVSEPSKKAKPKHDDNGSGTDEEAIALEAKDAEDVGFCESESDAAESDSSGISHVLNIS